MTSEDRKNFISDLWNEAANGIANSIVGVEKAWYGPNSKDYAEEKSNLVKYTKCWKYGLATAGFLFINFRITGSKRFIRWRERWMRTQSWNSGNNMSRHHQQHPHHHHQLGYLERKREESVKEALDSMRIVTDLLVSISVGTSGAAFLLHSEQDNMRRDFEQAPLVSGRSVVADEMCHGMIAKADTLPTNFSTDDPNMISFLKFVSNCTTRSKYEQEFRIQSGKLEEEPVVIPKNALQSE